MLDLKLKQATVSLSTSIQKTKFFFSGRLFYIHLQYIYLTSPISEWAENNNVKYIKVGMIKWLLNYNGPCQSTRSIFFYGRHIWIIKPNDTTN